MQELALRQARQVGECLVHKITPTARGANYFSETPVRGGHLLKQEGEL